MFMRNNIRRRIYQSNTPPWLTNEYARAHTRAMREPTIYSERLAALMRLRQMSQYALAAKSGVPQPTIQRILSGETQNPKIDTLRALGAVLSASESLELTTGTLRTEVDGTLVMGFGATLTDAPRPNPPATGVIGNAEPAPDLAASRRVPVVGTAQLGDNGYWSELEYPTGFGDGCVIAWTNDENAYAIRCRGDSMRPRIKDGEFVVVAPNQPPIPGDEVLVKHVDGRVMVKTFLYERDERLHLVSVNEAHPSVSFPLADVELFSPVVAILKKAMWVAA